MKVLQLCKKFPYPLKDGESIAVTYLSRAMVELGHEVSLLSMNTSKHYTDVEALPEDFNHYSEIHVTPLDNALTIKDAFFNLFSKDSYHVSRFVCQDFKQKLVELLQTQSFDVIQLETLYLTPYIEVIREHSDAIIAMRAHNVEFEIWERIAENTTFLPKKWYLKYLTSKLKDYELSNLNEYDYLIAVSETDLRKFKQLGYKNGAMASPIGLDITQYNQSQKPSTSNGLSLGFIGALDWIPNMEGLEWFLDKVWPRIHEAMPEVTFHIAGRNTPDHLFALDLPNVIIHGEVPDAVAFMQQYNIMVVPLFSGSGMRVKILEAMALGKLVISTSLGCEGIHAQHGEHILIADTVKSFADQILAGLNNASMQEVIGQSARKFILDTYDYKSNAQKLMDKYQYLLDHPYPSQQKIVTS